MSDKMPRSDYIKQVRKNIANNIRFYRHQQGLTQLEFAAKCGMSDNSIYLLENDHLRYSVPIPVLASIAHALDIGIVALFVSRETQPNPRGHGAKKLLKRNQEKLKCC